MGIERGGADGITENNGEVFFGVNGVLVEVKEDLGAGCTGGSVSMQQLWDCETCWMTRSQRSDEPHHTRDYSRWNPGSHNTIHLGQLLQQL